MYDKPTMKPGLTKILPDHRDYSFVPTFGATITPADLPENFSIYDGRPIPNQNQLDTRFIPAVRPLSMGCTAEECTFNAGLEDGATYPPDDFYFATPPGTDGVGRDIRDALNTAQNRGFKLADGTIGKKRGPFFNCYGSGKIDDVDAARIALWVNQAEKRGVSIGSFWYSEFTYDVGKDGVLPVPSFNTNEAELHNYICTGWKTIGGVVYLEIIPWIGMLWGFQGLGYMSRDIYNGLMSQPFTGSFTQGPQTDAVVTVGLQAYKDHVVYVLTQFIYNLYKMYA